MQFAHQAVITRQHYQRGRLERADVCELCQRAVVGVRLLQPEPLGSAAFAAVLGRSFGSFLFQFQAPRNFLCKCFNKSVAHALACLQSIDKACITDVKAVVDCPSEGATWACQLMIPCAPHTSLFAYCRATVR